MNKKLIFLIVISFFIFPAFASGQEVTRCAEIAESKKSLYDKKVQAINEKRDLIADIKALKADRKDQIIYIKKLNKKIKSEKNRSKKRALLVKKSEALIQLKEINLTIKMRSKRFATMSNRIAIIDRIIKALSREEELRGCNTIKLRK